MGVMGWGYKIYIVRALIYEVIKDFTKLIPGYGDAVISGGGDFTVLAEYTPQITTAEKDGAAPLFAAYYRFFPKMQGGAGNVKRIVFFAKADRRCAVDITAARTDLTVTHFVLG